MNVKYTGLIFIVLLLWASSYVGIRYSLEVFSPANLAFLRYVCASLGFVFIACFIKIRRPYLSDIPVILLMGLTGFSLYNLLLNFGERTTNAGIASFIINTVPFFTMLLAVIKKDEKANGSDWTGLTIALAGVFIIILTKTNGVSLDYSTLYIAGAAVCQALYLSMQKDLLRKYSPVELTSYSVWSGTLLLFLFSDHSFQSAGRSDWSHILSVIYLGLFPGMVAYLIIAFALKNYKASNVSSYLFLIPFITLLLGWAFLNETPSIWAVAGGILIVSGIIVKNRQIMTGPGPKE
jgi:drug/metabolite transporter (DMT)-like permease